RRHTRFSRDWSSDVCSSDLPPPRPSPASGGGSRAMVLTRLYSFPRLRGKAALAAVGDDGDGLLPPPAGEGRDAGTGRMATRGCRAQPRLPLAPPRASAI